MKGMARKSLGARHGARIAGRDAWCEDCGARSMARESLGATHGARTGGRKDRWAEVCWARGLARIAGRGA